jgi:putative endonuclease
MKIVFVYILLCADGTYYTGVTVNLKKRIAQHNQGAKLSSYAFARRPFTLVYTEQFSSAYKAIQREKQIKGWSRAKKEALIVGNINMLKALAKSKKKPKSLKNLSG